MPNCNECLSETKNPKFCNHSCAAKYNNRLFHKRLPEHRCKSCGGLTTARRTKCKSCHPIFFSPMPSCKYRTLADARIGYSKYIPAAAFNIVRQHARRILIYEGRTTCEFCGYSKHFEAAHLKSLASYTPETELAVVNASCNLLALCPNCHWEFDHQSK